MLLRQLIDITEAFILALALFMLFQICLQNYRVEGSSMSDTIASGEYVTVNKLPYLELDMERVGDLVPFWDGSHLGEIYPFQPNGPSRGDIVVFRYPINPERAFVKRIIGMPGEQISIDRGRTFVDGRMLYEPYVDNVANWESEDYPRLGDDEYFVMGDNRPFSNDSRHWGESFAVSRGDIIGAKLVTYQLPVELGFVNSTD